MVSVFCVGLGEFFTFSAMVLMILSNMGQLTENIVARSFRYVSINTQNFESTIRSLANQNNIAVEGIFATDQSAPELAGNGLKYDYEWGLYTFCAGQSLGSSSRSCSQRSFVYDFDPIGVLQDDINSQLQPYVSQALPASTLRDSTYLTKFTKAANYLAFIGTVVVGLSFLTAFLAHRFAFLLAALLALLAAGCLAVAAAIWTAIIYKVRHSVSELGTNPGVTISYGNIIWMTWAAFAASALSVIPLLIGCVSGRRSKY